MGIGWLQYHCGISPSPAGTGTGNGNDFLIGPNHAGISRHRSNLADHLHTLAKNTQGAWELVLPPPVRTDRYAADEIVGRLRNLSMQTIAADDKKKPGEYGFGAPSLRIELQAPSGSQTLVLGKQDKEGQVSQYLLQRRC